MALTALVAPIARSTNRSTPTMAATGCQLQNATAARPISACPRPAAKAAEESQALLTAEPLDLDYKHEIIRWEHLERDQAPAVRAEMQ